MYSPPALMSCVLATPVASAPSKNTSTIRRERSYCRRSAKAASSASACRLSGTLAEGKRGGGLGVWSLGITSILRFFFFSNPLPPPPYPLFFPPHKGEPAPPAPRPP